MRREGQPAPSALSVRCQTRPSDPAAASRDVLACSDHVSAVSRINHVSVNAKDLAVSVDFYVDVFGAEPLATPNFGLPVQWLEMGGRLSDASRGQGELSGLPDAAVREDRFGQGSSRRAHG